MKIKQGRKSSGSARTTARSRYLSDEFSAHLKKHGIIHQTSVKYTPEQNGVSEAAGKIIFAKVRCMLQTAGLPKCYWAQAAVTAVYIKNRSPTKAVPNSTPEGVWTGKEVDLSHLKVFGCLAYERKDINRKKLESRADKLIFVGYSETQKGGYYLVNPQSPKMCHVGRNLVFLENQFYHKLSAEKKTAEVTFDLSSPSEPTPRVTRQGGRNADAAARPAPPEIHTPESGATSDALDDPAHTVSPLLMTLSSPEVDNSKAEGAEASFVQDDSEYIPSHNNSESESEETTSPMLSRSRAALLSENIIMHAMSRDAEPTNVAEALSSRNRLQWRQSMESEIRSMMEQKVWTLVD